ncbi:MAG: hypothetical protein C4525_16820 [Desulfarculus sp.]|jgi:hypothetical protein|nr:MAG: hypothetical protein C4525_16820 [Desulfarculus sp.]
MATIYLQESFPDPGTVRIQVEGVLDTEALQVLEEVCGRHLGHRRIRLEMGGVTHLSREARQFLKRILPQVQDISLSSHHRL